MELLNAINSRKSIRAFLPKEIDKETMDKILELANKAPSWGNSQPWEVYVATGETLERIKKRHAEKVDNQIADYSDIPAAGFECWPPYLLKNIIEWKNNRMIDLQVDDEDAFKKELYDLNKVYFHAPAVVYLVLNKSLTEWSTYDLGAFSMQLQLAALEYGVQSMSAYLLVGYPDILREELGIEDDRKIVFGIAMGYPDYDHHFNKPITRRKPLEEFVTYKN